MYCRTVLIQNRLGLHARAAMKLFELAQSFQSEITISNQKGADEPLDIEQQNSTSDEVQVSADSIMGLLLLESSQGEYIKICASGEDAPQALDAVCALVEKKFDEDE